MVNDSHFCILCDISYHAVIVVGFLWHFILQVCDSVINVSQFPTFQVTLICFCSGDFENIIIGAIKGKMKTHFLLYLWISDVQMFEGISLKFYSKSFLTKNSHFTLQIIKKHTLMQPVLFVGNKPLIHRVRCPFLFWLHGCRVAWCTIWSIS